MSECIPWWGYVDRRTGYGKACHVSRQGDNRPAHRHVYEACFGFLPSGMQLHHICRNKLCVNPEHLEPLSVRDHALRHDHIGKARGVAWQLQRSKTHCPHGHEYTEANTWIDKQGWRSCRACNRDRAAQRRQHHAA